MIARVLYCCKLAAFVVIAPVLLAAWQAPAIAEPIRGAGSTFAAPVIAKWARAYKDARADGGDYFTLDWTVDYEPIGSLAGIMRLDQAEMDFAATDAPLSSAELAKHGFVQFPIVMGGIAVVANIEGVEPGSLRLTGPLLADIFSGKITRWADPAIAAVNAAVSLPDREIRVLRRQDGSGSTFVFTSFLSEVSPQWRDQFGADTLIKWAVGQGAEGTGKLAALAGETADSITYLEYGQVVRSGLPIVSVQNSTGAFVAPSPETFQAGLDSLDWANIDGFAADTTNMPGANAYPMSAVTYAVMPTDRGRQRSHNTLDFFRLAYETGGPEAVKLGYIPVSPALAKLIDQRWAKQFSNLNN